LLDEPVDTNPTDPASDLEFYVVPEIVWEHLRKSTVKPVAVPQPSTATAPAKQKSSGKISAKRAPRSRARDERNVRKCEALRRRTAVSASSPLVNDTTHTLSPLNTPAHTSRRGEAPSYSASHLKRLNANLNDKRRMAAWKLAGELSRMYAAGAAIEEVGALAFTLNLAGCVKAYTEAHPDKALAYLGDRIRKNLAAVFGHEVGHCFVLEVSPSGRLHVHGMLMIPEGEKARAVIALQKAGGTWAGKGAVYQADARRLFDARGWASYCAKTLSRTRRALGIKNVLSMSRTVRRLAEDFWNGMRAQEALQYAR